MAVFAATTTDCPPTSSHTAATGAATGGTTVGDVLAPTGLPALLDRPVADVLADLGVGPIQAPAVTGPGGLGSLLSSLPPLDPLALLKPITDLLATFGSGSLGQGGPVAALGGLAGLLQSATGVLGGAAADVSSGWRGQGATAAVTKATRTAADSGALAAQGTAISTNVQAAAGIVGAGLAQLQAVIVKTAGLLAATAPTLATPPGQMAALAIAAEGLGEAMAVVASTRSQLTVPTASVTAAGKPVPVTAAPKGLDVGTLLSQVGTGLQLVGSVLGGTSGTGTTGTTPTGTTPTRTTPSGTTPSKQSAGCSGETCCAACDHTSSKSGDPRTVDSKTGDVAAGKPTVSPSGVGPSSTTPAQSVPTGPPVELADRPVTSNASIVEPSSDPSPLMTTSDVVEPVGQDVRFTPVGVREFAGSI